MDKNVIPITCHICTGSGYERRKSVECKDCNKYKITGCIKCKSGYIIQPFETCRNCGGKGELKELNKKIIKK